VGTELVKHPAIQAVGFTGSFKGGKALFDTANRREVPIPVFAEMGSVNPVFVLPQALKTRGVEIARGLAASITLGVGQFCTNPGIMAAIDGPELEEFISAFTKEANNIAPQTMLNKSIWESFYAKKDKALNEKGVKILWKKNNEKNNIDVSPTLATISFSDFKQNTLLHKEIFGPYSLLVICENITEIKEFIEVLKGQLTTSVFADGDDFNNYKDIFELLEQKTGRLIVNNPPTGVEVCPSMHHGGPFPSTTDSRFTSVGTDAIKRFVRPVSYQNLPQELLPDEIKDGNPLKIWRYVNGEFKKD
jgi:NADP-dependent aldehyde dehydrogenase